MIRFCKKHRRAHFGECLDCPKPSVNHNALISRLRDWPAELGVMTPELAAEIAGTIEMLAANGPYGRSDG